ncbi:FAS1-like dehydratase domain-containing protein [Jonesia quinghaiensis]|uniref:FAS1-like dehydratase domain-containing protein n=1 Tax=Jonesia quinghaiensis TaxID=262806 RepID=UPI0004071D34|nr:MaoC family dehydratase N-terminal domain-containing protein [Jonesia quinghaiensis]
MSINHDYVGREYPRTTAYQVSREKIAEFARSIGSQNPACLSYEAARGFGYPDVVAPTTFAVIIAQRAEAQYIEDPQARVDFSRVVHADERFSYSRPIFAGDNLVTVLHVERIVERGGLAMVTTRCDIYAQGSDADEHVVTVRSTLAVRGEES